MVAGDEGLDRPRLISRQRGEISEPAVPHVPPRRGGYSFGHACLKINNRKYKRPQLLHTAMAQM
jgi:hypothetical protein